MQFTKDDAAKWAKRCKTRTKLFRTHRRLYDFMKAVGWLDEFYPAYVRNRGRIYLVNLNGYPSTYKIGVTDAESFDGHLQGLFKSLSARCNVIAVRSVKSPIVLQKMLLSAYGTPLTDDHYLRDYKYRNELRTLTQNEADSIVRVINEIPEV